MTTQTELRDAIEYIKDQSGTGSKARKQDKFVDVYQSEVAHLLAGERYDDAGVGPSTAQGAVEAAFGELGSADTLTETLAQADVGGSQQGLDELIVDLDGVARRSGDDQRRYLAGVLQANAEPSLVTLALLDDESIGIGTSAMRGAFFDGTRDERKRREAFTETTSEFISLAQQDNLDTSPTVGEPFDPMLAVPESRGEPDNPVGQRKLDGYRLLIHVTDGVATGFSRARNDVTESLPELNEIPWVDGDYILDAEVVAENGSYSDTSQRIGRKAENIDREVEMNFEVFDAIVYQGNDVSDSAFEDRFNMAMETVNSVDDPRLNIVPVWTDVEKCKDAALEAGAEGIIVKDNRAPYEFGKRSAYWQKNKYDAETVDVVVAGFMEGDGEKSGTLGAVEIESVDGVSLGRSGSGFSDAERDLIWDNQEAWLGELIEVEARGLGSNDNLRMPIYKRHRTEGEADPMSRIAEIMPDV